MQNKNKPGFITARLSSYNRFEFNLILIFSCYKDIRHPKPPSATLMFVVTHE